MNDATERDQDSWLEARLDLLLGQELHADRDLLAWVLRQTGHHGEADVISAVTVALNVDERGSEIPVDAHGETDIRVVIDFVDGRRLPLLIEDKVWAPFQPRQPERYRARADAVGGLTALVAPRAYLASRQGADAFDARLAIEDIEAWLRQRHDRRGVWVADRLHELVTPHLREPKPDHEPTAAFTDFCIAWFREHAPHVIPQRSSMHTETAGWLWFETPRDLVYKVVGWVKRPHAAVDLYLASTDIADEQQAQEVLAAHPPDGFYVTSDTQGRVVLRLPFEKLHPARGVPIDRSERETLTRALEACVDATNWLSRVCPSA